MEKDKVIDRPLWHHPMMHRWKPKIHKEAASINFTRDHICALLDLWRPPTNSTVKVSTDRCTAMPWAHRCLLWWSTTRWKKLRAEPRSPAKELLLNTGSNIWLTPGSKSEQGNCKPSQNINAVDNNIKYKWEVSLGPNITQDGRLSQWCTHDLPTLWTHPHRV